jgi:hypothetical protein
MEVAARSNPGRVPTPANHDILIGRLATRSAGGVSDLLRAAPAAGRAGRRTEMVRTGTKKRASPGGDALFRSQMVKSQME